MDDMNRKKLLRDLGEHCFAAFEIQIFLDTHPNDRQALSDYKMHLKACEELKREYEAKYGPLSASDVTSTTRWTWIDDPWPWNNEMMRDN